jgi:hypothetical protein
MEFFMHPDRNHKVTVCILNFNGLSRLEKSIPSMVKQSYTNFEVIVVDFGSSDGSLDYLKQFEIVKIIDLEGGFRNSQGRELLVKEATGEYVLMVDNDIEFADENVIANLLNTYLSKPETAFLSPLVLDFGTEMMNEIGLSVSHVQKPQPFKKVHGNGIVKSAGYYGNCSFFKKSIIEKLGGFDDIYPFYNNDYDLGLRAYIYGYEVLIDTDNYVIHHGAEARQTMKSICWRNQYYASSLCRIVCKNYLFKNLVLWLPVVASWAFVKSIRFAVKGKSICPVTSYFKSMWYFVRDFRKTWGERRIIQSKRTVAQDVFLKIKPPEFE